MPGLPGMGLHRECLCGASPAATRISARLILVDAGLARHGASPGMPLRGKPRSYGTGGGSGRIHNQAQTQAMLPIENHFTQASGTHQSMINAHSAIVAVAIHLALRLTAPWRCQLTISGPNCGWASSQRCRRSEPCEAAHAEISTNTVVGSPGTKMPTMPMPRLT